MILVAARPKLQKWISDAETDDPESLGASPSPLLLLIYISINDCTDTFLQINDQINTVLTRYDAFKKGDFSFASNPIPKELAAGSGASQGVSLIDFDDSAPTSSETTGGVDDLSGLFASAAQPVQANITMHAQQQQQPQPPFTYAPTPLSYNNNSNMGMMSGMNAFMQPTANAMSPHRQLSGTPPASIALPQSKPTSQRSTPALPGAATPNYFGNVGPRGPISIGGMGVGGGASPMGAINAGSAPLGMNLSGAMSGMSLNGGSGGNMGMGSGPGPVMSGFNHPQSIIPHQQPTLTPAPAPAPTTTTASSGQKDPFADLAGLF